MNIVKPCPYCKVPVDQKPNAGGEHLCRDCASEVMREHKERERIQCAEFRATGKVSTL